MALSAIEKIKEIQEKADFEIRELRQQAVSEIVRNLAAAKEAVKTLEAQYEALTGEKPSNGAKKPRKHLTDAERTEIREKVRGTLAEHPTGISMASLIKEIGGPAFAVKAALKEIGAKTTGATAKTRYFLK